MTKVRIIGGGLTGVLAAFEAHRLGCRDIELHERFDMLGGDDLPALVEGLELRGRDDGFGPRGARARQLLEWHGLAFEDLDHRACAVVQTPAGLAVREDDGGPTLGGAKLEGVEALGPSLADRLRCYEPETSAALRRYCQWRLGAWMDHIHESAAADLGLDGEAVSARTSQPRDGYHAFFQMAGRTLAGLGVKIRLEDFASPRQAIEAAAEGETIVWACDPTCLFGAMGVPAPKAARSVSITYFHRVRPGDMRGLRAVNFAAIGQVAAIDIHQSRGQAILAADCLVEMPESDLRREIGRLTAGLGGEPMQVLEPLGMTITPRRGGLTVEAVRQQDRLRQRLANDFGGRFVTDAWRIGSPNGRLAALGGGLSAAFATPIAAAA